MGSVFNIFPFCLRAKGRVSCIICRKIIIFFAGFIFLFHYGALQAQSFRQITEKKLNTYFSKDAAVKDFVSLTRDTLFLYGNREAKAKREKPEMALNWKEAEYLSGRIDTVPVKELKHVITACRAASPSSHARDSIKGIRIRKSEDLPLAGLRVAIDPGHIGGSYRMGKAESRCMTLHCDSNGKCDSFRLVEGNLTFFTALILKKKLELKGAEVMLTRKDTGQSSLNISFGEWKKRIRRSAYLDSMVKANLLPAKDVRLLRLRMADKLLFEKIFGSVDMAERAKKMNEFHPDLSVIIHYNVNEQNTGWQHPTGKDFVMAFVGGCVVAKDLETEAGRLNFLRLLLSPDIENSVDFSSKVVRHLSADLGVLIATKEDATYLSKKCLSTTAEGVYSRDLALTRLTRGTLVYGEALYQDNEKECRLLTANDGRFQGFIFPERIEQVANAYFKGILEYLAGWKKN